MIEYVPSLSFSFKRSQSICVCADTADHTCLSSHLIKDNTEVYRHALDMATLIRYLHTMKV